MREARHMSELVGEPALVELEPGWYVLRFEIMKAMSALGMLEDLLRRGEVRPGDTVVDSSSGTYALALAMACHRYGVHCHIVASTSVDESIAMQLGLLGAVVETMPASADLGQDQNRRVARVQSLLRDNPGWRWMCQYHDPGHQLGYVPVARNLAEVLRARGAEKVSLVAPIGTGASSAALCGGLREAGLRVNAVAVEPFGSVTFGAESVPDPDMLIAGIGSAIEFENVRHDIFDVVHWISCSLAVAGARALMSRHAIFGGLSAGAAYVAAGHEHRRAKRSEYTVSVCPDTGHRYVPLLARATGEEVDVDAIQPVESHRSDLPESLRLPWTRAMWTPE